MKTQHALKQILLRTYEGYGPDRTFQDFASANRYIRLYSFQSRTQDIEEVISFEIQWEGSLSFSGTFPLPQPSDCEDSFLQDYLQEQLESQLLYGVDFSRPIQQYIETFHFQMDYLYSFPSQVTTPRMLLLSAEGLDAQSFLAHERLLKETNKMVQLLHPLLADAETIRRQYLATRPFFSSRTTYYQGFVGKKIRSLFKDIVDAALKDEEGSFSEGRAHLQKVFLLLRNEQDIVDERFTQYGKEMYHIFEGDKEPSDKSLTEHDAHEILRRLDALRFASYPRDDQSEKELYLSLYVSHLSKLFKLPKNKRSHYRVSLQTASRLLKKYQVPPAALLQCINECDPMAVCNNAYGNRILQSLS